ncbi:glycosyltransferase family 4 protein [Oscillatoria sp. CS-180]|uniref:glycosyltransferase family 4 protein n=1 Tax=Oscillatoria sp. CS-180 TaxID=3021720 RepID=UPI00232D2BC1|nr:glycosyltransferase family 4 protein [Oscillatoria sp. CS-180]MDB9524909.1 glycosyltransferase family 4 protein [Oscillatoria sp. CS-180]
MLNTGTQLGFVFLQVFSHEGGIQSYIKDVLAAYLKEPTSPPADVFLLRDGPDCYNPFEGDKITFHYLKSFHPLVERGRLAVEITKCLLSNSYQHIICGHVLLTPLLSPLCQLFDTPYTTMIYGKEVWNPVPLRQRKALQGAKYIWANSRYSRDLACVANSLNPAQFHMLPCIVDGDIFSSGAKNENLLRRYDLQNRRVLMTVARLWSGDIYKGVDVTIRALPTILRNFPDVKYLVVGRGDDQPRLAELAKDLGVEDQVVFAGFVPNEDLVEHYRLADAYIMPSKEGFGIVYLEAMACGVPTLSGDDDGSADPLQDGRLGWRVPYRDPKAVAEGCIEILKGDDIRCDAAWLREQTLAHFGRASLQKRIGHLLSHF